jgi:hypothetical protein
VESTVRNLQVEDYTVLGFDSAVSGLGVVDVS